MKVCFFRSSKPREGLLADAFTRGVLEHGDEAVVRPLTEEIQVADDCEVAVMVGVKSRELYQANWNAGVHVVMLDKGYTRHSAPGPIKTWEYWRVAVDAHHPTRTLMNVARPHDRLMRLGLVPVRWRKDGKTVVIAGSSQKYHDFYGISDPTSYAEKLVRQLSKLTSREIVYRPKPSWKEAVPIEGATFSRGPSIMDDLTQAHVLVTHGSNACFEAVLNGVPCIILGDAVAKPISSVHLDDLEAPMKVGKKLRIQWLANLAYCQWTMPEMASGETWEVIRPQIYG